MLLRPAQPVRTTTHQGAGAARGKWRRQQANKKQSKKAQAAAEERTSKEQAAAAVGESISLPGGWLAG